ncbi:collagen-like protein [Flaviaesturariibacter amylovorans]|uniref:DUF4890 domain-containing protein n=1 Tax=Flaviaesturariibacter amylovorans TaxID=1084520 RepID=A0ABP8G849_9BACT
MKKILSAALALLLFAGAAQAQSAEKKDKGARKGHRNGKAALNLSEAQKTQLKDIHQRQKAEMEAVKANKALSNEQRMTQRKAIHEKYKAERKALLTPEQQQQAAQYRDGMRGDRDGARRDTIGRRGGPRGEKGPRGERGADFGRMQQELNLSAEQQQRVKTINTDFRSKMEALRNDQGISQEQRRSKHQELAHAHREQLKAVLTPEQQEKANSLRKGKGKGRKGGNVK